MGCKYCEYRGSIHEPPERRKTDGGDVYSIEYDTDDNVFNAYTWDQLDVTTSINKICDVRYCPFCGGALKAPSLESIELKKKYDRDWKAKQEKYRKEQEKRDKEHKEWLEREYKNNPYDPTKPRLKNKYFRNAVKNFAKYMKVDKFYWDDEFRCLRGNEGGYMDFNEKCIGPCHETNGVMETFHEGNGKTYTVRELCYGYKEEE